MRLAFFDEEEEISATRAMLNTPAFAVPLMTTVVPLRGSGGATFTRATTATVVDFEGLVKNVLSGEVRFQGQRRVENLIPAAGTGSASLAVAANKTVTVGVGTFVFSIGAEATGTSVITFTGTATGSTGSLTADATSRTAKTLTITAGGTIIMTCTVAEAVDLQLENVTGQANQNPSEYVSTGVLSSPYHGAMVDGVKYFDYENGNTVASNVVTEATGEAIPDDGLGIARLPGVAGSYFSTPDAAANSITGDLTLECELAAPDWTPSTTQCLIAKSVDAGNQISFYFRFGATGFLTLTWSPTGAGGGAAIVATATAAISASDGTALAVKAALDVDNDAGGYSVRFYTSPDRQTWTQLGDTVTGVGATSVFNSTSPIEIGSRNAGADDFVTGVIRYAKIYSGSTLVADFNPNDWESGSTFPSSTTGEEWTLNGGAQITKVFPGFLQEQASPNLVLQSENFGATWLVSGTPTRSAAAKYCGSVALDLIGDDDAAAAEGYVQDFSFTADAVKAVSAFVARGSSTSSIFGIYDSTAGIWRLRAEISWSGGVPSVAIAAGPLGTHVSTEALGGGVYRLLFTTTSVTAANTNSARIYPATNLAGAVANTGTLYIGGVQAENSTICTSYIPTTTAAVTRNEDLLSYTDSANVANARNLYVECYRSTLENNNNGRAISLNDGTTAERIDILHGAGTAQLQLLVRDGAVDVVPFLAVSEFVAGAVSKAAVRFDTNNSNIAVDGSLAAADTVCTMPTVTTLNVGSLVSSASGWNGVVRRVKIWNRALPDSVLQSLTA